MPQPSLTGVLRYVRSLVGLPQAGALTDALLLQRFAVERDEAALVSLLQRHGPLVLAVCQQVTVDPHAAEDVFQATFLILARKAASIRLEGSLAPWLHRVALRAAIKVKSAAVRCQAQELEIAAMKDASTQRQAASDWQPVLHEELDRLPEKYRAPVVLCYLQGQTHDQAARELGWPVGTVRGRLARARDLLQRRLVRRGVALSVGVMGASGLPLQAVPMTLTAAVVQGALASSSGALSFGVALTPSVGLVVDEVLRDLAWTRLRRTTGLVLAMLLLLSGLGVLARPMPHEPKDPVAAVAVGAIVRPAEPAAAGFRVFEAGLPLHVGEVTDGVSRNLCSPLGITPTPNDRGVLVPDDARWYVEIAFGPRRLAGFDYRPPFGQPAAGKRSRIEADPTVPVGTRYTDAELQAVVAEIKDKAIPGLCFHSRISPQEMAFFKDLPQLRTLIFFNTGLTDATLREAASLPNLEALLLLQRTQLTNEGLAVLRHMKRLKILCITDWPQMQGSLGLTDAGLEHLQYLSNLERLELTYCDNITDQGLAYLARIPALRTLRLRYCPRITAQGLAHLKAQPRLTTLELTMASVTDAGVEQLQELTGLKSLTIRCMWGFHEAEAPTPVGQSLSLRQGGSWDYQCKGKVTEAGLAPLRKLTGLEELTVSSPQLTDAGMQHLGSLTGLKKLCLGSPMLTGAGFVHLRGLTQLECLDCRLTALQRTSATHLRELPKLRSLLVPEPWTGGAGLSVQDQGYIRELLPGVRVGTEPDRNSRERSSGNMANDGPGRRQR